MHLSSKANSIDAAKNPRVGVSCIIYKNEKILLGQRKGSHGEGYWATPGGHLEFGESIEDCAIRELLEETGLTPLSLRLGPWVENLMENGLKHYITLFVFIDSFEGEPTLLEPDKCMGWEWFSCHSLPEPLFPSITSLISKDPSLFYTTVSCKGLKALESRIAP